MTSAFYADCLCGHLRASHRLDGTACWGIPPGATVRMIGGLRSSNKVCPCTGFVRKETPQC